MFTNLFASVVSVFARSVKVRRARRMTITHIEGLEPRQVLSAATPQIMVLDVVSQEVEQGEEAILAKLKFGKGKWSPVESMYFEVADGTDVAALDNVHIMADLIGRNGRRGGRDGVPDTEIAVDFDITDGWADLDFGRFSSLITKRVPLWVIGKIGESAPGGTTVGLKDPIIVPVNDDVFFDLDGAQNPLHTIKQQAGSLFVTQELPIPSKYILAGTQSSAINFALTVTGRDAPVTAITFAAPGNIQSIDRIYIYSDDQPTTPIGAATIAAVGSDPQLPGYTLYKAVLSPDSLDMTNGLSVHLTASPLLKNQDFGAVSSEKITLQVHRVEAEGFGANDGDANGNENEVIFGNFPGPDQIVAGPQHTVSFAKVASVTNWNPDVGNVPTGIRPIGRVKITAAPSVNLLNGQNKVEVLEFNVRIEATNIAFNMNNFKVYNMNDATTKTRVANASLQPDGSISLLVYMYGTGIDNKAVPGGDITFAVEADITNPVIDSSKSSTLDVFFMTESVRWSDPDALPGSTFIGLKLPETKVNIGHYAN